MDNKLILVLACDSKYLIGRDNTLPWSFKEDLENFKKTTTSLLEKQSIILMGYNTLVSLNGRRLPNRINVVVSSDAEKVKSLGYKVSTDAKDLNGEFDGIIVFNTVEEFLSLSEIEDTDTFLIGGAILAHHCLEKGYVEEVILTRIPKDYGQEKNDVRLNKKLLRQFGKINRLKIIKTSKGVDLSVYSLKN